MKIAILSCFYPFRGGIAQFNANLLNELGRTCEVRAFNFKRQYPDFLFPGRTQYVTAEDSAVPVESTALLDTANPFSWFSTAREIRRWKPDVLILRYWMSWFAPSLGHVAAHTGGSCKVIAILDNVIPHEPHFFDAPLTKAFLKGVDGCVCMCDDVADDLLDLKPDAVYTVLPHPVYTHFGEGMPRDEARDALGIPRDSRTLLFFGLIREYKGLDVLINAFGLLADKRYHLVIAGEPYGPFDKYRQLIDECPSRDRIHLFPEYIPDAEVRKYFCAADVAVLPYRTATQSGISAIADNFELPMIVTDAGGLRQTIGERGTGIVCTECSPRCVASAVEEFFADSGLRERLVDNIRRENDRLSWSRFAADLKEFAGKL